MGRQQDRPASLTSRRDDLAQIAATHWIQVRGRLVQNQQLGLTQQSHRESEALKRALGERIDSLSGGRGEAGPCQDFIDSLRARAGRNAL